tara:strand:- start:70 stop:258 length:189 start_codon:yes stop_codon:yes gene_type:complete
MSCAFFLIGGLVAQFIYKASLDEKIRVEAGVCLRKGNREVNGKALTGFGLYRGESVSNNVSD